MRPSPNAVFLSDIHQIASGVDATVAVSSALSSQIARLHTRRAPPSAVDWLRRGDSAVPASVWRTHREARRPDAAAGLPIALYAARSLSHRDSRDQRALQGRIRPAVRAACG